MVALKGKKSGSFVLLRWSIGAPIVSHPLVSSSSEAVIVSQSCNPWAEQKLLSKSETGKATMETSRHWRDNASFFKVSHLPYSSYTYVCMYIHTRVYPFLSKPFLWKISNTYSALALWCSIHIYSLYCLSNPPYYKNFKDTADPFVVYFHSPITAFSMQQKLISH